MRMQGAPFPWPGERRSSGRQPAPRLQRARSENTLGRYAARLFLQSAASLLCVWFVDLRLVPDTALMAAELLMQVFDCQLGILEEMKRSEKFNMATGAHCH
jgi:hypothetical protein